MGIAVATKELAAKELATKEQRCSVPANSPLLRRKRAAHGFAITTTLVKVMARREGAASATMRDPRAWGTL